MPHQELHTNLGASKLNWLRASVLGANDGVVSVASIVVGVAGATDAVGFILTAGIAGLTAGALSMAMGEYVSVSAQRDTERALLEKERWELKHEPEAELAELTKIYEGKGLAPATAAQVARELTAHDAFAAHVEAELRIDPSDLTSPWQAAFASAASFLTGGVVPLLAIVLAPKNYHLEVTIAAVVVTLGITGTLSAYAGGANKTVATARVVIGGLMAMAVTYGIGRLFGVVGM